MGFFDSIGDFVGDIFNPENIGTAIGGLVGSAVPGLGTALGAGLGRAAGGLFGGDASLGGAIQDVAMGAGLGAAAGGGLGSLISAGAGAIGPGGTPPIAPTGASVPTFGAGVPAPTPTTTTEGATAQALTPTTAEQPPAAAPPQEEDGGFLDTLGDVGSGVLNWLGENPGAALGVVQSLMGYQSQQEAAEYQAALVEEERKRKANLGRVSAALSRGLVAQLP